MLNRFESLPEGFLSVSARELHTVLPGPSLIHLPGRRSQPLFVSILLHGNEDVGLRAVQRLLREFRGQRLPRALSLFVGNVAAARQGLRRLDGQPDYNRVWPVQGQVGAAPEQRMMAEVVEEMGRRSPFAAVDLHNNTGLNPHYACINRLEQDFYHLARLFSRTVVYFLKPEGVASMAMARLCPAITCECGRTGDHSGVEHALAFLQSCLKLSALPDQPIASRDIDLFHTVATVKVPPSVSFGFGEGDYDIRFIEQLDHLNFSEVEAGTVIARVRMDGAIPLQALDEQGRQVEGDYFQLCNGELKFARRVMPAMLTRDVRVIEQDCLCYLMERYPLPDSLNTSPAAREVKTGPASWLEKKISHSD